MRKIIIICIAIAAALPVVAQKTKQEKKDERKQRINALIKQEEEGVIAFRKHSLFAFKLTNDGYGAFYEFGKTQSIRKVLLFQMDFSERKHPKEEKQTLYWAPGSPIIFGKINYFYPLKLGVQQQILLGNKTNKNGVSVTANFGGGISVGFLRPYYLEISDDSTGDRRAIKYDSPDSILFSSADKLLEPEVAVTSAGFGKGWGNMKVTPGLYAKAALRFDYGRYNEAVSAIEVGGNVEYYTKNIPQLIFIKQKKLFFNVYVAVLFGRRK